MTDIASLGIKVESNLKTLNKDMEKTISLSEKVTNATNKINESFKSNVVEASKIIEAEKKKASAIDKMISSIKMQNIALVEGKSGLADYKLSILGASESQKKFAQDIIASMESVRSARKSESEQVKSNLSSFKSALSEQAKVSQMAQDAEKSRLSSINSIIDSLSREEKSLSMTKQEQTKYNLALLGASDAEKKSAQDIQNRINAIKDSEKAQKQATAQEKEAAKIASNLAKEQAQAQKQIADAETKRKDSINGIILKLRDEAATVGKSKAELTQYQLTLLGASEAEKKEAAALQNRIKAMQDANAAAKSHDSVLGSLISRLSALGAAYFGVQAIKNFASSLIDTAKIADNYKYSLQAVSDSNEQAGETFNYLVSESKRLGTSVTGQVDAFTGFAASAKAAGLTVEETRSAYTGLNEAMTALHRSPEQAGAALNALQQMLATGTVRAQELNIQLANAIPGAVPLFAKALDKDVGELKKLMKDGLIPAKEAVILFTDYLSNNFQNKVESASNSVTANITKMNNAWFFFKKAIIDSAGSNTTNIIKDLTNEIESLTSSLSTPEGQKALKNTADGLYAIGKAALWSMDSLASFFKILSDVRKESKQKMDTGGSNPFSQFIEGIQKAKEGELSFLDFFKASIGDRSRMLKDIDSAHKSQSENSIKYLQKQEQSWNALWVESLLSANGIMDGIKRISDAEIKRKQEAFKSKGMTIQQGEELEKLTDKIKEQAEVAGKTDIQIMEGNLRKLTSDEALIKSQLDLMRSSEAKNQAVKDADKASQEAESAAKKSMEERKRAAEQALKVEEDRRNNITDIIKKLQEERDTLDMTKEQLIAYKLALLGATPAQIAFAQAIQKEISAAEERKRVTADFKSLQEKLNPELKRQNDLMADFKVVNDAYAMGLIKTKEEANKLKESLEFNSFSGAIDELKDKLKFEGTNFGNEMADGINNAVISMQKLNIQLDKQAKNQKDIDKLQKEIDTTSNLDLRAKKQKKMDELTEDSIKSQMSGYRQLFGTASQLFKENSREREVMHNIEMAFAAAEIAMNLEKTISAAYLAIAESGTLPPPASFAAIAAMTALMAGIVAAAGGSLSGGGSASAPSVSASSTQGTGTVMGNPSEKSQSANNALEFMKDIEAKQYNELRDINKGVVDLNNNITNLVTSIVRTGAGTGDMGIKTGTSTSTSELQNISSKGFLAAANLMSLGTISASQAIASLTKNIPVLGNITAGVSDWINNTVSSFSSAVFGGTKKTSILAQGLEVSTAKIGDLLEGAGIDIQKFADIKIKKSGGLFGSDKTYLKTITENLTPDEESIKIMFTNVFKNVGETMVAISSSLNLGEDNLAKIYQYTFDIGKIDLKGMDTDQINETIAAVINTASDEAVTALFGELIGKYVQVGEALLETAIRVVSERAVVLDILEMTGQGFKDSDIPEYSLEITQSLISIAGGIKELQEASVNYYDKFFSDEEKQIRLQGQLTDTMASLGTTLPTSRKELRNFVEGLDLSIKSEREAYVTILGLTDGFDKFFTVIEDGQAITDANNQAIKKNISDIQIASAQMDMTPFEKSIDDINRSTNAAIETNKALGASESDLALIRAYGDKQLAVATKAEEKRKEAEEAATQATKDATEARIKSLTDNKMVELLEAEGKSTEALALKRSIELAGMEESLIPMQEKIYKLQDEKAAYEITSKAVQERIDKEREVAEAIKAATDAEFQKEGSGLQEAQLENMRVQGKISLALATERAVESREMGKMVLALKQSTWAIQDKLKIDNKMIEILNLEGKTTEALYLTRQIELSGMEESLRGYQLRIYALQDEKAKQEEIAKTTEYFNAISAKTIEILTLEGKTTEATNLSRQLEINKMDASLKPLQERIWILEDAKKAEEESVKAIEATIQKENAKNSLLVTLLELEGSTADATRIKRMLEINAMDEALRPMQERIYALQDQVIEEEKIQSIADKRNELNIRQLRAMGKEEQALAFERTLELNSLDATLRAKQINIWMLEDEKEAQEKATQALEESNNKRKALLEEQVSLAEEMLKKSIDKQISFYQTLADEANKILEDAKNLLDRSFASEQESITKKHESLIAGLTLRLEEAQTAASDLETVFNSLSDARKSMEGDSGGLTYKAVQKQLIDAISMAKGGDTSGAKGLVPNLGILTSQGTEKYGSNEDYKRDFFKTYNALSELESLTGTQLTEQKQIIKALETQIEESNINNQATLDALQNQYDAVLGVDKSVVSFQDAIAQYQKAQYEADGANALLKTQTEILNNQLNVLLGIDSGILSVSAAINALAAAQASLKSFSHPSIPAFANGGTHYGGLRSVGENGPEMEYTPPSNITSNNDLKSIMSNEEVVAELKAMRAEQARANFELVKNSDDSKKTLREWKEIGIITRSA